MIQTQILPIAFQSGVNTKVDDKQLTPGTPTELLNVTFISPLEIKKRNGYRAMTGGIGANMLITRGDELAVLYSSSQGLTSNMRVYSEHFDGLVNLPGPAQTFLTPNFSVSSLAVGSQIRGIRQVGLNGPAVAVHEPSGLARVTSVVDQEARATASDFIVDLDSNNIIQSDTLLNKVGSQLIYWIQNVTFGDNLYSAILFGAGSAKSLSFDGYNAVTSGPAPGDTLFNMVRTSGMINFLDVFADNNFMFLVYQNDVSGDLILRRYTPTMVATQVTVSAGLTLETPPSVVILTNGNVLVTYKIAGANGLKYAVYSSALTVITAVTDVPWFVGDIGVYVTITSSPSGLIMATSGSIGSAYTRSGQYNFASSQRISAGIGSRPIPTTPGATDTVLLHWTSTIQPTYMWTTVASSPNTLSTVVHLAPVAPQIAYTAQAYSFSNTYKYGTEIIAAVAYIPSENIGNVKLTRLETNFTDHKYDELAGNTYVNSGVPMFFDGVITASNSFQLFPETVTTNLVAGDIPPGTYQYVAVYKYVDNNGNVYRSAPSLPKTVTIGPGSNSVEVTVSVNQLFQDTSSSPFGLYKPNQVRTTYLELYRTLNSQTIFYEIYTQIIPGGHSITITDNTQDIATVGRRQLYTTGEVANIAPPAYKLSTVFKNRLIVVDAENPLSWWFSKQILQGIAVEFSDEFVQQIDQRGGPISALTAMDDKLIFFKRNILFYVVGDGPAPSGTNGDFSYPQIISTDVGSTNQLSLVLTPIGVFFQSQKGIYLLGRDLTTSFIGNNVEEYTKNARVTSARVIPTTTQIRFTLDSGVTLVYDYFVQQWSVFTVDLKQSVVWLDSYVGIHPGTPNTVWQEQDGLETDVGTPIPIKFVSGWLNFGGVQGFQRVKEFLLLGESTAVTDLKVSLAFNFKDLEVQETVIDITETDQPTQYRVFPKIQKAESMRITIEDAPETPSNGIISLSSMTLEVGIKKGPFKMPARKSYG